MVNIKDSKIINLLPPALQSDKDIQVAAQVLDKRYNALPNTIDKLSFMAQPTTDSNLLDVIAYDLHVDFFDKTFPIEMKQELIDESEELHRIKGTGLAVEKLITIVFGEGFVEEWFEYGGKPFHFRVLTNNDEVTTVRAQEFIQALNSVKRKTAILDSVTIIQSESMNLYFGGIVHIGDHINIEQVV